MRTDVHTYIRILGFRLQLVTKKDVDQEPGAQSYKSAMEARLHQAALKLPPAKLQCHPIENEAEDYNVGHGHAEAADSADQVQHNWGHGDFARLEVNLAEICDLSFFKHAYRTACLWTKVLQVFDIDFQLPRSLVPVSGSQIQ